MKHLSKFSEMDNKFDYEKNVKIVASDKGYDLIEEQQKSSALEVKELDKIEYEVTPDFKKLKSDADLFNAK